MEETRVHSRLHGLQRNQGNLFPTYARVKKISLKTIFFTLIVVSSVLITLKSIGDYQSSRERGRFVVSMLRENRVDLQKHFRQNQITLQSIRSPRSTLDTAQLQSWLYQSLLSNHRPQEVSHELTAYIKGDLKSSPSQLLVKRWNYGLIRWEKSLTGIPSNEKDRLSDFPPLSTSRQPVPLFEQARLHYYEASGYQKVGRKLDATVLYLWSSELLTQFIELNPASPDVAQALFLLGASQVRIRSAFSSGVRSDRLLNLCVELYPDSVWATLARELRREEFGYAV